MTNIPCGVCLRKNATLHCPMCARFECSDCVIDEICNVSCHLLAAVIRAGRYSILAANPPVLMAVERLNRGDTLEQIEADFAFFDSKYFPTGDALQSAIRQYKARQ